jgi:hypothetical protein
MKTYRIIFRGNDVAAVRASVTTKYVDIEADGTGWYAPTVSLYKTNRDKTNGDKTETIAYFMQDAIVGIYLLEPK